MMYCVFKTPFRVAGGVVLDEWFVKSAVVIEILETEPIVETDEPSFIHIQINDSDDDALQAGGPPALLAAR